MSIFFNEGLSITSKWLVHISKEDKMRTKRSAVRVMWTEKRCKKENSM